MKIKKSDDREISFPPYTCFALFPEDDSDRAFIAELVMEQEITADKIHKIAKRDPTIGIESLSAYLFGSPNSADRYAESILAALTSNWQLDQETVLQKSFWIRARW